MLSLALHMHWKWVTATCSSKGLMPSMTPRFHSFKRESCVEEELQFKVRKLYVKRLYVMYIHGSTIKKQERIFGHTQRTSKTKVASSHLTQPQAIHILTSSPSEQSALYPTHWRWSQPCLKHVVRYWRVWGYAFVPAASLGQSRSWGPHGFSETNKVDQQISTG